MIIDDVFLILAPNTDCGCSLEPPGEGGSNECPQSMFSSQNKIKKNKYPHQPHFSLYKVGFPRVFIRWIC